MSNFNNLRDLRDKYKEHGNPAFKICDFLLSHSNSGEYLSLNLSVIKSAIDKDREESRPPKVG